MGQPLPYLPVVQPGESPLSFLRRGALGNGHHSALRFAFSINGALDHSKSAMGTLARNPALFHETCKKMGISDDQINAVAYSRIGKGERDKIKWKGLSIPLDHLQFQETRICVTCYLEQGYALADWDHVATMACAKHRVLLDDSCPCCGSQWAPELDPLACGCSYEQIAKSQLPCSEEVATAMQHIIDSRDQDSLKMMGHLWHSIQSWIEIGVELTKSDIAISLSEMSKGEWPKCFSNRNGDRLHPRVALAPLLGIRDSSSQKVTKALLGREMPPLYASRLNEIQWPAVVAQSVLGIGRVPFKKIVDGGHITLLEKGLYPASTINELLWAVAGKSSPDSPMQPASIYRSGQHRKSLATLITMIKAGGISSFSCPPLGGLADLHCELDGQPPVESTLGFNIQEAATFLGTNSESVRQAIKLGLIPAIKNGSSEKAVQWIILKPALDEFNAKFMFASAVARQHNTSVTTIASRFRSAGLVPSSGPDIDGGVSYLFHREDLANINISQVLSAPYKSPAGRKKHSTGPIAPLDGFQSSQEAAEHLGISVRQLREVVRRDWITPTTGTKRKWAFYRDSVLNLKKHLDENFLTLTKAAKHLNQTPAQFRKTWISTATVRSHVFADQVLIERADFDRVRLLWEEVGSASSISADLNRERWLCPNLTKMGQLPVITHLGTGSNSVRLYKRTTSVLGRYALPDPDGVNAG